MFEQTGQPCVSARGPDCLCAYGCVQCMKGRGQLSVHPPPSAHVALLQTGLACIFMRTCVWVCFFSYLIPSGRRKSTPKQRCMSAGESVCVCGGGVVGGVFGVSTAS